MRGYHCVNPLILHNQGSANSNLVRMLTTEWVPNDQWKRTIDYLDSNLVSLMQTYHTLPKLWRYIKPSLVELVPLEILIVSTRINSGFWSRYTHWTLYMVPKCGRVLQNAEVVRITLLYSQNFGRVHSQSYYNWSLHRICLSLNSSAVYGSIGTKLGREAMQRRIQKKMTRWAKVTLGAPMCE